MELSDADVADILALLDSLPYDVLDLRTDRFRLTLRRTPAGTWTEERQELTDPAAAASGTASSPVMTTPPPASDATAGQSAPGQAAGEAPPGEAPPGEAAGEAPPGAARTGSGADRLAAVLAPLPGTFYRAPRPGADPFVEAGDTVTADTVVAIMETMKLMNSVAAGTAGRVARICLGNGEFAATGTTLILIEPDA